MEAKNTQNVSGAMQSFSSQLLNVPYAERYETAGARSTRMIIDSASYTTTPCSSPPPEPNDTPYKVLDAEAAPTEVDHGLQQQQQQQHHQHHENHPTRAPQPDPLEEAADMPSDRKQHPQGIVPPYMLHAIAASTAAGPQARACAEQTLVSSRPTGRDSRAGITPGHVAPAQRQLEDGRWVVEWGG